MTVRLDIRRRDVRTGQRVWTLVEHLDDVGEPLVPAGERGRVESVYGLLRRSVVVRFDNGIELCLSRRDLVPWWWPLKWKGLDAPS